MRLLQYPGTLLLLLDTRLRPQVGVPGTYSILCSDLGIQCSETLNQARSARRGFCEASLRRVCLLIRQRLYEVLDCDYSSAGAPDRCNNRLAAAPGVDKLEESVSRRKSQHKARSSTRSKVRYLVARSYY